ncbi:MAG: hypothetical protein OEW19_07280, partial [Acidobacteriota bacterium]|nr:hypothetical protein [Acidobacteriota bacterium]
MQVVRPGVVVVVLVVALCAPGLASGQAAPLAPDQALRNAQAEVERLKDDLGALREQYDARLAALESRLTALAEAAAAAPPPEPAPIVQQAAPVNSKIFNPDISVIGNSLGVAGTNPNSDQPTFGLDEVETSFQAIV